MDSTSSRHNAKLSCVVTDQSFEGDAIRLGMYLLLIQDSVNNTSRCMSMLYHKPLGPKFCISVG